MALPFFRALNPTSDYSGINYSRADGFICNNMEMIDDSVIDGMNYAIDLDRGFISALSTMTIGCHYDLDMKGREDARGGAKGILDFLIFPLIARKLIADALLPESNYFSMFLAVTVGLPLEITRLLIGTILTIVLSPFVLFIRGIKACVDYFYPDKSSCKDDELYCMVYDFCNREGIEIPDEYLCRIDFTIMKDPVYIVGREQWERYDKKNATLWIKLNSNHPTTADPCSLESIKPDHKLKEEIKAYVKAQYDKSKPEPPPSI